MDMTVFQTMFADAARAVGLGLGAVLLLLAGFFLVKSLLRLRENRAYRSYQLGVVAPVQYGDRGPDAKAPAEQRFAERLDEMVEREQAYDMARLLPKARELGAVRAAGFHTEPVLEAEDIGVLSLIEAEVAAAGRGCRVLVNPSLESLVAPEGPRATRLAMAGILLKFAVVDKFGRLVMAIDHLDGRPMGRQQSINRAVMIEVLRKAGVWYLEIPAHFSRTEARAQIAAVLRGQMPGPNPDENVA